MTVVGPACTAAYTYPMEKYMRAHMTEEDKQENESIDQRYLDKNSTNEAIYDES